MTLGLEGRCSIQLSYGRLDDCRNVVGAKGFEPPTSCSQSRRATGLRYAPPQVLDKFLKKEVGSGYNQQMDFSVRRRFCEMVVRGAAVGFK